MCEGQGHTVPYELGDWPFTRGWWAPGGFSMALPPPPEWTHRVGGSGPHLSSLHSRGSSISFTALKGHGGRTASTCLASASTSLLTSHLQPPGFPVCPMNDLLLPTLPLLPRTLAVSGSPPTWSRGGSWESPLTPYCSVPACHPTWNCPSRSCLSLPPRGSQLWGPP